MAEPTLIVTESTPASAESEAAQQFAWTQALDAPLMLLAPLVAGWVFVRHYKRARAAEAAHAHKRAQRSAPSSGADVIALHEACEPASKRTRRG